MARAPLDLDLDLGRRLGEVPSYGRFPSVDEQLRELQAIADAHPGTARIARVGSSRLGEPLLGLRIEGGPRHALVFGSPHPNEPIGCLTALHLARTLCADGELRRRLDLTWHVVPCADPDGMRLNEGWFDGPLTRTSFGRHFFRPAPTEQVEWTFPFAYKRAYFDRALPETVALMRLIDEVRPVLLSALHNSELGGAYYYLSGPAPALYPVLHDLAERCGIPLDLGEPEVPHAERMAPAIYRTTTSEDAYDWAERIGLDPLDRSAGASSTAYAARYGAFSIMSETPYWTHPDVADETPTELAYADLLRERGADLRDLGERLLAVYGDVEPDLVGGRPLAIAVREFAPSFRRIADADARRSQEPSAQRPATVAERFSCLDNVRSFRLRYAGMLLRLLEGQVTIGNGTPAIRRHREELATTYAGWCAEAEAATPATPLPIRDVVALQYGALLAAAAHVTSRLTSGDG
ncbi:MAG: M14 family zinc carboxypeptidase [Candidatus Dormiibacterota bacterium]